MPRPGFRHYLSIAGVLVALPSVATDAEDAIAECARVASTGDRIICLENALRRLDPAFAADDVPEPPEPEAQTPMAVEDTPEAPVVENEPDAFEVPAATAGAGTAAAVGTQTPAEAPTVELGTEQLDRDDDVEEEQVRVSAKIVDHALVGTGRLRFTLDNGQIWQQTGDDDDRIARRIRGQTDIDIEMWQARSGGYRMLLVEQDRVLRVRRVR